MAELKNCRKCRRIFPYIAGVQICEACKKEEDKLFERIWKFLRDNPGVSMRAVSEELEVPYEQLMRYLKEGRLQIKNPDGSVVLFCEKCGEIIKAGRICEVCEKGLTKALKDTAKELKEKVGDTQDNDRSRKEKGGGFRFIK